MTAADEPGPATISRLTGRSLFSAWRAVMSVTVLGSITGFLASTVAARSLGAEGFGIFAIATNLLAILTLVATAGYQMTILRYGPKFLVEEDGASFRALVKSARTHTMTIAVIAMIVTVCGLIVFPRLSPTHRVDVMIVIVLALPFAIWSMMNTVINRVFGHLQLALLPDTVIRHIFVIGTGLIGYSTLAQIGSDPRDYAVAILFACVASGILTHKITERSTPDLVRRSAVGTVNHKWILTALTFFGIDLLFLARTQIDVLVVAALVTTKEAGIYAIALRLGDVLYALTTTLSFALSPRISEAMASSNRDVFLRDQKTAALIMSAFGALIGAPLILASGFWLSIFGPEFHAGASALIVITIASMIRNFAGPYFYILTMTGHQNSATRLMAGAAITQLILLAALTGPFGALGAAIARAVPDVLTSVMGWEIVRRRLGITIGLPALFR